VSEQFRIKRNDTLPDFTASLTERDPNSTDSAARRPLDLSNAAEIKLVGKTRNERRSIGGVGSIDSVDPDDPVWAEHDELTPYQYKVRYAWSPTDTEEAAEYLSEIQITWAGGAIQTVPARGYFVIVVEEDQG